jgi:hypothetical protein
VIALAGDPDAFASAISEALSSRTPEASVRRIQVARENSWTRRIDRMVALIEEARAARSCGSWSTLSAPAVSPGAGNKGVAGAVANGGT